MAESGSRQRAEMYKILDDVYNIVYCRAMQTVIFVGTSRNDIREFPELARREMGRQLLRLQNGLEPASWKPMKTVGAGVREIRIHIGGEYRAFYAANIGNAIYVLHAFRKKTQATPTADIELGRKRFKMIGD